MSVVHVCIQKGFLKDLSNVMISGLPATIAGKTVDSMSMFKDVLYYFMAVTATV